MAVKSRSRRAIFGFRKLSGCLAAVLLAGFAAMNAVANYRVQAWKNQGIAALAPGFAADPEGNPATLVYADVEKALDRLGPISRQTLLQAPLSHQAASQMALWLAAAGRETDANRLMAAAQSLSRRDILSHLWFVERYSGQGAIAKTLGHYDLLLRVRPDSGRLLYPVLASALDDPEIQQGIVRIGRTRPPWFPAFASHVISHGNAEFVAKLFVSSSGLPRDILDPALQGQLIATLFQKRKLGDAVQYYLSLPHTDPATLTDASFSVKTVGPDRFPLTWAGSASADTEGNFIESEDRSGWVLTGSAAAGRHGPIARRLLILPAAIYTFRASSIQKSGGVVRAALSCVTSTATTEISRFDLSEGSQHDVSVPSACDGILLDLELHAPQGQQDVQATISNVALSAAGKSNHTSRRIN